MEKESTVSSGAAPTAAPGSGFANVAGGVAELLGSGVSAYNSFAVGQQTMPQQVQLAQTQLQNEQRTSNLVTYGLWALAGIAVLVIIYLVIRKL